MSKNRYINTKFWDDEYISDLQPINKLLFLYLLTNTLTNICGIYEISIKRMVFDTGIKEHDIELILESFELDNKIKYEKGWLAIKNFIKHQKQSDKKEDNINKGIISELKKVPTNLKEWVIIPESLKPLLDPSTPSNYPNLNSNLNLNSNIRGVDKWKKEGIIKNIR